MVLGITAKEEEKIKSWGYKFFPHIRANGQPIDNVIFVVHDERDKHDSGYPYIIAFGCLKGTTKLIQMGWHDHYFAYLALNTDALGKNIFRVACWDNNIQMKIKKNFIPYSSLSLEKDGTWR